VNRNPLGSRRRTYPTYPEYVGKLTLMTLVAERGADDKVGVAAIALGWSGELVKGVECSGYAVDVIVRFNHAELIRRHHGPPVLDRAALRAMMNLPMQLEVPVDVVPTGDLQAIELGGESLVERTASGVRRTYEPACDIVGIIATGQPLSSAVNLVGMFSAYSERAVYGSSRQCGTQAEYAQRFGVGVVICDEQDATVLVQPERRGVRPTSSRWRFCELVYDRWLRTSASDLQPRT
jgi:hypothetical protein